MVAEVAPAVVSPCETVAQRAEAVERLLMLFTQRKGRPAVDLSGAERAADEILALFGTA